MQHRRRGRWRGPVSSARSGRRNSSWPGEKFAGSARAETTVPDNRTTIQNTATRPDDLVIASPALAWALDARVADFQQALIAEGVDTIHLPGNLPSDRFAYDTRYSQARFVVIDRIWRNWAAQNMVEVAEMMSEVETWELAFKAGELEVYENLRIKGSGL